uniref:Zinc-finger domain-containing protein n=2 Tax=Paracidobacterium acidisoli TaxID=2303751 RepID=A0A372IUQ0_9BACT
MGFGPSLEHDQYEELCALATAGVLSPAESKRLTDHLESCAECREALEQYQAVATDGMSFLAKTFGVHADADADGFDESSALRRLMQTAEPEGTQPAPSAAVVSKARVPHRTWARGLVAACVVCGAGVGAYWAGTHSANARLQGVSARSQSTLDRAKVETQTLEGTILADNRRIAALEQQSATEQNDIEALRTQTEGATQHVIQMTAAADRARSESDAQMAALRQERDVTAGKLHDAEKMYQAVQYELNTLRTQHQQDQVHLASLETSVDNLNGQLSEQNKRSGTDEHYLAADKDIRDLIGARNLYIADIMDVNDTGQSRKPFGRVFYTKTKSLIFYAYDLDRQPGVRRTSTFQVWGRTSPNDRKPINLGILYMDSETNRRWTLRVNSPEQLARLDSVFVTIEPHEQTDRPTGKPFLYASLQRVANHP